MHTDTEVYVHVSMIQIWRKEENHLQGAHGRHCESCSQHLRQRKRTLLSAQPLSGNLHQMPNPMVKFVLPVVHVYLRKSSHVNQENGRILI